MPTHPARRSKIDVTFGPRSTRMAVCAWIHPECTGVPRLCTKCFGKGALLSCQRVTVLIPNPSTNHNDFQHNASFWRLPSATARTPQLAVVEPIFVPASAWAGARAARRGAERGEAGLLFVAQRSAHGPGRRTAALPPHAHHQLLTRWQARARRRGSQGDRRSYRAS